MDTLVDGALLPSYGRFFSAVQKDWKGRKRKRRQELRFKQDKDYGGPLVGQGNTKLPEVSPIVLTDRLAWAPPDSAQHVLPTPGEDCIVVGEWVATLWGQIELENTVEHVASFSSSEYVARVDSWGFNVMRLSRDVPDITVQLTNDGVMVNGVPHESAEEDGRAQQVEDIVQGQDIPAYFPGMLCDSDRNQKFRDAIQQSVGAFRAHYPKARCRVVDIGAGTGLLTHYALEAGADHVTAIEGNPLRASIVRKRFDGDPRVEVFEGFSTKFMEDFDKQTQTAPFDMIITETLGTWAHFEKGHDYLKDFVDRGIVSSTLFIVPQRIRQFLTFRAEGEFDGGRLRRTPRALVSTRYATEKCADTQVHLLWDQLMPNVGDPPVGLFESMRLSHAYLTPDNVDGDLEITHPKNLAPHKLDDDETLTLPEKYRLVQTAYKLKRLK